MQAFNFCLLLSFQLSSRIKKTLIASEFHALLASLVTRSADFCAALPPWVKVPSVDVTLSDSIVNKERNPWGSSGAVYAPVLESVPSQGLQRAVLSLCCQVLSCGGSSPWFQWYQGSPWEGLLAFFLYFTALSFAWGKRNHQPSLGDTGGLGLCNPETEAFLAPLLVREEQMWLISVWWSRALPILCLLCLMAAVPVRAVRLPCLGLGSYWLAQLKGAPKRKARWGASVCEPCELLCLGGEVGAGVQRASAGEICGQKEAATS